MICGLLQFYAGKSAMADLRTPEVDGFGENYTKIPIYPVLGPGGTGRPGRRPSKAPPSCANQAHPGPADAFGREVRSYARKNAILAIRFFFFGLEGLVLFGLTQSDIKWGPNCVDVASVRGARDKEESKTSLNHKHCPQRVFSAFCWGLQRLLSAQQPPRASIISIMSITGPA